MHEQSATLVANTHSAAKHSQHREEHHPVIELARHEAVPAGLTYAGIVAPEDAWSLFQEGAAVIIDVRTAEERKYVGHVPETIHVAWATGMSMTRNPRFVKELETKAGKDKVVLFLCRSGKRSALAAEAATKAGYRNAYNIGEGFEGEIDEKLQRGRLGGWRQYGLPWVQD